MALLSDFRTDIGDESIPSGVAPPNLTNVVAVRVDVGDDDNTVVQWL